MAKEFGQEPEQVWASEATMPEQSPPGYMGRPVEEALKIDDHIYTYRRGNHRTMFVVTDEGVIVLDPMKTAIAEGMYKVIRELTDAPIKYMIYSHNHWDHTGGGKVFKDAGAVVVAHDPDERFDQLLLSLPISSNIKVARRPPRKASIINTGKRSTASSRA